KTESLADADAAARLPHVEWCEDPEAEGDRRDVRPWRRTCHTRVVARRAHLQKAFTLRSLRLRPARPTPTQRDPARQCIDGNCWGSNTVTRITRIWLRIDDRV